MDLCARLREYRLRMSTLAAVSASLAAALVLVGLVIHSRGWHWTGFADKTLWDWLQLMVVPLVLAALAFALNSFQDERDQRREEGRARLQRSITLDERREDTLRAYLQDMSELLIQRRLGSSDQLSPTRSVARTLTLTTLRRLDGIRKGVLIRFLSESQLIKDWRTGSRRAEPAPPGRPPAALPETVIPVSPVIDLAGADLRNLVMNGAVMSEGAAFAGADLRHAQFRNAVIVQPNFMYADLRYADFSGATLDKVAATVAPTGLAWTCLSGTRFVETTLFGVTISGAGDDVDFSRARLHQVKLKARFENEGRFTNVRFDGARLDRTFVPKGWGSPTRPPTRRQIDEQCAAARTGTPAAAAAVPVP